MKQKLEDLKTLIRADRRLQVLMIALIAGFLFIIFFSDNTPRRARVKRAGSESAIGTGSMGTTEAYEDLVRGFNGKLESLESTTVAIQKDLETQRKSMQDYEATTAEIFRRVIERLSEVQNGAGANGAVAGGVVASGSYADPVDVDPVTGAPIAGGSGQGDFDSGGSLESFGMEEKQPLPPPPPPVAKVAYISTGDSVKVQLLSGVNAPTDGTPYPVVFKFIGDVVGPDGSSLPLGESRIVAAAQGSLTDARVLFRLTDLSVRLPDGRRKVMKVDGWVVGEDGIRGMAGVLNDPIGKAIGGGILTGALEGFGRGIRDSQQTTLRSLRGTEELVTGNTGKFAAGSAIIGGSRNWSSIVQDRLDQMVPVVQVLAGRDGTAVFSKSTAIEGLIESMDEDGGQVASLD